MITRTGQIIQYRHKVRSQLAGIFLCTIKHLLQTLDLTCEFAIRFFRGAIGKSFRFLLHLDTRAFRTGVRLADFLSQTFALSIKLFGGTIGRCQKRFFGLQHGSFEITQFLSHDYFPQYWDGFPRVTLARSAQISVRETRIEIARFLALPTSFHLDCTLAITQSDQERVEMGRWRPPGPKSSPYITPAGFETLQKELQDIWVRRRDVVKALAEAAAEGDRSENAEYLYRKKELGGLDRRIRYLQKRLPALNVVRESPSGDAIYFGAFVEVRNDTGDLQTYRIVGADEADAKTSAISMDSPFARALLSKRVGDEVVIRTGEKTVPFSVVSIWYEQRRQ